MSHVNYLSTMCRLPGTVSSLQAETNQSLELEPGPTLTNMINKEQRDVHKVRFDYIRMCHLLCKVGAHGLRYCAEHKLSGPMLEKRYSVLVFQSSMGSCGKGHCCNSTGIFRSLLEYIYNGLMVAIQCTRGSLPLSRFRSSRAILAPSLISVACKMTWDYQVSRSAFLHNCHVRLKPEKLSELELRLLLSMNYHAHVDSIYAFEASLFKILSRLLNLTEQVAVSVRATVLDFVELTLIEDAFLKWRDSEKALSALMIGLDLQDGIWLELSKLIDTTASRLLACKMAMELAMQGIR